MSKLCASTKTYLLSTHLTQVAPESHFGDIGVDEKRPTGRVVGIIKRNWRDRGYCGSLQVLKEAPTNATTSVLFMPVERRFPMVRCVRV